MKCNEDLFVCYDPKGRSCFQEAVPRPFYFSVGIRHWRSLHQSIWHLIPNGFSTPIRWISITSTPFLPWRVFTLAIFAIFRSEGISFDTMLRPWVAGSTSLSYHYCLEKIISIGRGLAGRGARTARLNDLRLRAQLLDISSFLSFSLTHCCNLCQSFQSSTGTTAPRYSITDRYILFNRYKRTNIAGDCLKLGLSTPSLYNLSLSWTGSSNIFTLTTSNLPPCLPSPLRPLPSLVFILLPPSQGNLENKSTSCARPDKGYSTIGTRNKSFVMQISP